MPAAGARMVCCADAALWNRTAFIRRWHMVDADPAALAYLVEFQIKIVIETHFSALEDDLIKWLTGPRLRTTTAMNERTEEYFRDHGNGRLNWEN
jgi:hypothetical protein